MFLRRSLAPYCRAAFSTIGFRRQPSSESPLWRLPGFNDLPPETRNHILDSREALERIKGHLETEVERVKGSLGTELEMVKGSLGTELEKVKGALKVEVMARSIAEKERLVAYEALGWLSFRVVFEHVQKDLALQVRGDSSLRLSPEIQKILTTGQPRGKLWETLFELSTHLQSSCLSTLGDKYSHAIRDPQTFSQLSLELYRNLSNAHHRLAFVGYSGRVLFPKSVLPFPMDRAVATLFYRLAGLPVDVDVAEDVVVAHSTGEGVNGATQ